MRITERLFSHKEQSKRIHKYAQSTLASFGFNLENLSLIGSGLTHLAFKDTTGEGDRVIKIVRNHRKQIQTKEAGEKLQDMLCEYFGDFYVPVKFMGTGKNYVTSMSFIEGQPVTDRQVAADPDLKRSLAQLVICNQRLMREHDIFIDFVGLDGFVDAISSRRGKEIRLSNVLFNKNGLHLIDSDPHFIHTTPLKKLGTKSLIFINERILKRHFGLLLNT